MREKLLDLMKNEGLKPSQLAEMLGINPAGISHILAGRNKPSFELLQKILRRFPRVDPDWLLLDAPHMYRDAPAGKPDDAAAAPARQGFSGHDDLFSAVEASGAVRLPEADQSRSAESSEIPLPASLPNSASVARVVVFYDDHTFESFTPHLSK